MTTLDALDLEVSSGLIILWQFRHLLPESRQRTALRLLGGTGPTRSPAW